MSPGIAQGIFGLVNTGLAGLFNRNAQRRQFADNKSQSQLAYGHDVDMWNRQTTHNRQMWDLQNEYNLPANQMARLRQAGLNPNLMYGNASAGGQATSIQQASQPKYSPARAEYQSVPLQIPNMIAMHQDFKIKSAQMDNVKAQNDLTREKALTEAAMRVPKLTGLGHDVARKYVMAKYAEQFAQLQVDQRKQALENAKVDQALKRATIPKTGAEAALKQEELKWMKEYGMRSNDPLHYRWIIRMMEKMGDGSNWIQDLFR